MQTLSTCINRLLRLGKFGKREHFFKLPTIVMLNMKMFSRYNKLTKVNLSKFKLKLKLIYIFMNFNVNILKVK